MIVHHYNDRIGISLARGEALTLIEIIASADPQDVCQRSIRAVILELMEARLGLNVGSYKRLPFATENRPTAHEMGVVKLFEQARACPAIRAEAEGLLKAFANSLANLVETCGPRAATPSQFAHRKDNRW